MSLFVKIIKSSNAAWDKPKILLDEESLQQREIAYEEKLKKVNFLRNLKLANLNN